MAQLNRQVEDLSSQLLTLKQALDIPPQPASSSPLFPASMRLVTRELGHTGEGLASVTVKQLQELSVRLPSLQFALFKSVRWAQPGLCDIRVTYALSLFQVCSPWRAWLWHRDHS